jgi:hypothetical protein
MPVLGSRKVVKQVKAEHSVLGQWEKREKRKALVRDRGKTSGWQLSACLGPILLSLILLISISSRSLCLASPRQVWVELTPTCAKQGSLLFLLLNWRGQ